MCFMQYLKELFYTFIGMIYNFSIKFGKRIAFLKPLCYYGVNLQNRSKKNIEKLNKKEGY